MGPEKNFNIVSKMPQMDSSNAPQDMNWIKYFFSFSFNFFLPKTGKFLRKKSLFQLVHLKLIFWNFDKGKTL